MEKHFSHLGRLKTTRNWTSRDLTMWHQINHRCTIFMLHRILHKRHLSHLSLLVSSSLLLLLSLRGCKGPRMSADRMPDRRHKLQATVSAVVEHDLILLSFSMFDFFCQVSRCPVPRFQRPQSLYSLHIRKR